MECVHLKKNWKAILLCALQNMKKFPCYPECKIKIIIWKDSHTHVQCVTEMKKSIKDTKYRNKDKSKIKGMIPKQVGLYAFSV